MKLIPYHRSYKRDQFSCGKPSLDNYILKNATKDIKAGACTCFVVLDEQEYVIAFYTLATQSIPFDDASDTLRKSINYPHIPVILLGRLAVHELYKGKGLGKLLLADALKKCLEVSKEKVGAVAVIVDPIDKEAESFYAKYGFTKLPDSGRMFMTMWMIEEALRLSR